METSVHPVRSFAPTGYSRRACPKIRLERTWSVVECWRVAHEPGSAQALLSTSRSLLAFRCVSPLSHAIMNRRTVRTVVGGRKPARLLDVSGQKCQIAPGCARLRQVATEKWGRNGENIRGLPGRFFLKPSETIPRNRTSARHWTGKESLD